MNQSYNNLVCEGSISNGFRCGKPATTVCVLLTRKILRCHEHEDDFISVVLEKIPIEEWVGA
jgi:hypothetical protein